MKGDKVECAINGTVVASYDKGRGGRGETEVHGRGLRSAVRAQHGSQCYGLDDDEELRAASPGRATQRSAAVAVAVAVRCPILRPGRASLLP